MLIGAILSALGVSVKGFSTIRISLLPRPVAAFRLSPLILPAVACHQRWAKCGRENAPPRRARESGGRTAADWPLACVDCAFGAYANAGATARGENTVARDVKTRRAGGGAEDERRRSIFTRTRTGVGRAHRVHSGTLPTPTSTDPQSAPRPARVSSDRSSCLRRGSP